MKVKVNVGCSNRNDKVETEKEKIRYAVARQVDYISEISLIPSSKNELLDFINTLDHKSTKFCTVPLYDSVLTNTDIFAVIKQQHSRGIKCFTLHLTPKRLIDSAIAHQFVINSRAGNFLYVLAKGNIENPHFEVFEKIISFIRENDCELFVGTSLRPGRVAESKRSQLWLEELNFIKSFMESQGVHKDEYILECGGHIDSTLIDTLVGAVADNKICVMGPLVTDATNAYDDLSSIIGATALRSKKEIHTHLMLTRDEHIRLPTLKAFKRGLDIALVLKHNINLIQKDEETVKTEDRFRNQSNQCTTGVNIFGPIQGDLEVCTMCGRHCPLRNIKYPSVSLEKKHIGLRKRDSHESEQYIQ